MSDQKRRWAVDNIIQHLRKSPVVARGIGQKVIKWLSSKECSLPADQRLDILENYVREVGAEVNPEELADGLLEAVQDDPELHRQFLRVITKARGDKPKLKPV